MISTEEFTARVEHAAERQAKHKEHTEQLQRELQALCALAGMACSVSGDYVWIGKDSQEIVAGNILEDLVAPAPDDDAPFGFLRGLRLTVPVEVPAEDAPVHIEHRDYRLLRDLADCLSEYLEAVG